MSTILVVKSFLLRNIFRIRRWFIAITMVASIGLLIMTAQGLISFTPVSLSNDRLLAIVQTTIGTVSTIAGIVIALVLVTAQVSRGRLSVASVEALYRNAEVPFLLFYLLATVVVGHVVLVKLGGVGGMGDAALVDITLILGATSVMLVIPTLLLQLENLKPQVVAAKLAARITPRDLIGYGLTHVKPRSDDPKTMDYELRLYGLRPKGVDPLRPLHEVLMIAIDDRDRVLFGKLIRNLFTPIALVYSAYWDPTGLTDVAAGGRTRRVGILGRIIAGRYSPAERLHVALALLHYAVKRAWNMKEEWGGRDTGRHGIIVATADLLRSLGHVNGSGQAITISLYAILHTTRYYSEVPPYGRIEPLNMLFPAASMLLEHGYRNQADLTAAILGYCRARTAQVGDERAPSLRQRLSHELRLAEEAAFAYASSDNKWLPGNAVEDPWRRWYIGSVVSTHGQESST